MTFVFPEKYDCELEQPHIAAKFGRVQTTYRVSVHPSTWYVLRVTARNAAGSTDCFLKFQTTRHEWSTASYATPVMARSKFYERIDVVISFCGVVVTIILVLIAVCIYIRRRREMRAERLAHKVCAMTNFTSPLHGATKQ